MFPNLLAWYGKTKPNTSGPMTNVMAAQLNIGGALCKSSVIPFLVPRHKVWLMATAQVSCSHTANIEEHKTWTQTEFCSWQNSV